jgi:hypothetical protein
MPNVETMCLICSGASRFLGLMPIRSEAGTETPGPGLTRDDRESREEFRLQWY